VVCDLGLLLLVPVAAHQVLYDLAVGFHVSLLSCGSPRRCALLQCLYTLPQSSPQCVERSV
jgi:hypothetical protein